MNRGDTFERIVELLNEAMLDDARWPQTSALIDEAFGAKGSVLGFGDEPTKGDYQIFFTKCYFRGTDRSAWVQEYLRDYHPQDEHLPRLRVLPDSKIVPIADLFTDEELKTSRTYNDLLARCDGQKGLTMRLDGPGGSRIVWGIADPVDAEGWASARIDTIVRVLPHIRQYVRMRTALADAGALGASVAALLDHTGAGIVHLDRRGRIVEANDSARELLRRGDGLYDQAGSLKAKTPVDDARLQSLLARALPRFDRPGASGSMLVRRSPPPPSLSVHVKPVTHRETGYQSRAPVALVLIVDPVGRAGIEPHLVQAALGLTTTETEVALLLAEGRTLRQIAATTGRGYNTVRTHLQHIFVKLGVSRQFEVAQRVLALSSLRVPRD